jgi:transcriptional regulator with XRE-family HTH domain
LGWPGRMLASDMSDVEWDIGPRLRQARGGAGLSVARLSALTGLSKTYLLKLETQPDANPSLDALRRIAEALDLTVADLIGAPALHLVGDELEIPPTLKAFADEAQISRHEMETLASIRWRRSEAPQTVERWQYIYKSLKASKVFDT